MKSARSHLLFVNRWVEVSDCDESQSTTGTHAVHTRALTSKSWNTLHAWMHTSPHYCTVMECLGWDRAGLQPRPTPALMLPGAE